MGPITIVFGVVLIALGAVGYVSNETRPPTALIPAYFGLALALLGGLALNDKWRKHAMHLAAMVGLIGFVVPLVMAVRAVVNGELEQRANAVAMQITMGSICVVFVALCVKSFIDARRRRKQGAAMTAGETPAPRA